MAAVVQRDAVADADTDKKLESEEARERPLADITRGLAGGASLERRRRDAGSESKKAARFQTAASRKRASS